jgi:hypothetical protein
MIGVLGCKKMRLARINCGARKQAGAESDANKNPENKKCFRGMNPHRDHTALSFTFFYPDYTVGSGITPDHALRSDDLSRYYKMLVGFTTDRELHPAPKVIKLCCDYTRNGYVHAIML